MEDLYIELSVYVEDGSWECARRHEACSMYVDGHLNGGGSDLERVILGYILDESFSGKDLVLIQASIEVGRCGDFVVGFAEYVDGVNGRMVADALTCENVTKLLARNGILELM